MFEEKPHLQVIGNFLDPVKAKKRLIITICFRPRKETVYEEIIHFSVAGSIEKNVTIHGEGVPMKVWIL